MELLAPAGSPEAVTAAVQSGADAVYLGYGDFNARRNAANFSWEELAAAAAYCHLRGVKVYLTLNTLLTDRELPRAAQAARQADEAGVDAILVQDLGVARMLRRTVPDMALHASTQLTIHTLDGARMAAELGMSRVVLSRELSRDQIAHICQNAPVEVEVFVHGALCMCYSGQCFFSAVLGGRSGNRGLCAQPCRLNYGWNGRADKPLLSLKDMSLAGHLRELEEMGVACAKIEGRMKRPEYAAVVTRVYAGALREGREPTAEELRALEAAFSRQGFTDGYFTGRKGPEMFGVRQEGEDPSALFAREKARYSRGEHRLTPVDFTLRVKAGEPVRLLARDGDGHEAAAEGPPPEEARSRALTGEEAAGQLAKTGGTPFQCRRAACRVGEGLALPLSRINGLRREALEALSRQRTAPPARRRLPFRMEEGRPNRREPPGLTLWVRRAEQLTEALLDEAAPLAVYLPLTAAEEAPEAVERVLRRGAEACLALPRVFWDRELPRVEALLERGRALGAETLLAGNLGHVALGRRLGFRLRGDFGLGAGNSLALEELAELGLQSAAASFEGRLARVRDLSKALDTELIVYGRLPLMVMENCIIRSRSGSCACQGENVLTDRKGARFPVVPAFGCRNEILNSRRLFLADRREDWQGLGLWAGRLMFTTEDAETCVRVARDYRLGTAEAPEDMTRGLYDRDVE